VESQRVRCHVHDPPCFAVRMTSDEPEESFMQQVKLDILPTSCFSPDRFLTDKFEHSPQAGAAVYSPLELPSHSSDVSSARKRAIRRVCN
jgi:hypothetical protein